MVRGSIPSRVIPKTLKIVLDTSLLNTQHYNLRIKGKVGQRKEYHPHLHLAVVAIEKEAFGSHSTEVTNFTYFLRSKNKNIHSITKKSHSHIRQKLFVKDCNFIM